MDDEDWNNEEFLNALVQTLTQFDNPNPNPNTKSIPNHDSDLNPDPNSWPSIPNFNKNDNGGSYIAKDSSMCFSPPPELSQRHERVESSFDAFGRDKEKSWKDKKIEMLNEELGLVSKKLILKEQEYVELRKDMDKKSEQIRIAFDQIEHKDAELSRLKCIDLSHHTKAKDDLADGPSNVLKSKGLASASGLAVQEICLHKITDEIKHSRSMGVQTEFDQNGFDCNAKSYNMERDLSKIWGIPQSKICGRNLISEISVTCSADLHVLFKSSSTPRSTKSDIPNYGDSPSPHSVDNAKLSHFHDILAKVCSETASLHLLLEALFDLWTLENVEAVHASLHILHATLKYLSCQTRSNRRKNVLVNHSQNNYLGGERFGQTHNTSDVSNSGSVDLDNLFKLNGETLKHDMRISSETMIDTFEKMQQVVLSRTEEQIQTEALSIMNLMLMTCIYADREKFGLVKTLESLPQLLRKEKGICVREKAVRLLFLILNCPRMLSMFCDWEKTNSELVKQIKCILEGLAESLSSRGGTAQALKLRRNIITTLAFIASLGKFGFDVLLYPATPNNVNFLELIISTLALEMDAHKDDSDVAQLLCKERFSIMREALILLNRLASNPIYAKVTLSVLTSEATTGLTVDVANRMSRKSLKYWNLDSSTKLPVEDEIIDLAGIFKTRVFTYMAAKNAPHCEEK